MGCEGKSTARLPIGSRPDDGRFRGGRLRLVEGACHPDPPPAPAHLSRREAELYLEACVARARVNALAVVAEPDAGGSKRETIKKSRDCLAMVLDHYRVEPNPARDKRVKLPRERRAHVPPPLAEHVERVAELLPRRHVRPLLIVDECAPRVNELATAQVGDLDEHRKAIRVRWTVEKNERYRHLELPDDLFDALLATLPTREDRDLEAPLFPELTDARLRTAITKACKATGTPHFSRGRAVRAARQRARRPAGSRARGRCPCRGGCLTRSGRRARRARLRWRGDGLARRLPRRNARSSVA